MNNSKSIVLAAAIALPCIFSIMLPSAVEAANANTVAWQEAAASRLPWARPTLRSNRSPQEISINFAQSKIKRPKRNGPSMQRKTRRRRAKGVPQVPVADVAEYKTLVSNIAQEYGVPVDLAHAIVTVESNYYPRALGKAGEIGLMQIMPATARGMGYSGSEQGLFHPPTNIKFGMKYLAAAYKLGGRTTCGAVLKYNAGHGAKRMNPISSAYCAKVKRLLQK